MANATQLAVPETRLSFESFRDEVLNDYRIACISRFASLMARKEVLTGKAKFGIFGDGKEVAQVAMAEFFNQAISVAGTTAIRLSCSLLASPMPPSSSHRCMQIQVLNGNPSAQAVR